VPFVVAPALWPCLSFLPLSSFVRFFLFHDSPLPDLYTLSLHDALPICRFDVLKRRPRSAIPYRNVSMAGHRRRYGADPRRHGGRSEEHTSELQSRVDLVCRLLLEKKKQGKCDCSTSSKACRQWIL